MIEGDGVDAGSALLARKTWRTREAPLAVVDALEAAATLPFEFIELIENSTANS